MISHELKTIFLHIPRTGGTSIETALVGNNWWKLEPKTKHLDWKQAKSVYNEYWDDYLKFTVVRNSWDWMASLYHSHNRGGRKTWAEYVKNPHLYPHEQDTLFQSEIIGTEMDHVLRYETLNEDFLRLCNALGVKRTLPQVQIGEGTFSHYSELYTDELREAVGEYYKEDIKRFNFKYVSASTARMQDYKSTVFALKARVAQLESELDNLKKTA